jgi:hypothetical protein
MLHRRAVATAVGLAVGLGLAGTGAAANEVRYIGEFSGPIQYVDCVDPQPGNHVAGGTWRANVHEKSVTARFVITVDGQPHVAWTAPMERVAPSSATFEASILTGAGPLTIMLDGEQFTYTIAPYDFTAYGGAKCASVTYSGTLTG